MQCLMSKTNFFACMLSMILVSNPPQNEYSEFFFLLVTLHIIISPIHPIPPKKRVPITLNLQHTVGGKDQFLFFSNL